MNYTKKLYAVSGNAQSINITNADDNNPLNLLFTQPKFIVANLEKGNTFFDSNWPLLVTVF